MSSVSAPDTFLDAVLRGDAIAADADDWVDRWHELPDSDPGASLQLHEFLGLSWDEYQLFVARPESLRFVVRSRETHRSVEAVAKEASRLRAVARSADSTDAAGVLEWLRRTGRIANSETD